MRMWIALTFMIFCFCAKSARAREDHDHDDHGHDHEEEKESSMAVGILVDLHPVVGSFYPSRYKEYQRLDFHQGVHVGLGFEWPKLEMNFLIGFEKETGADPEMVMVWEVTNHNWGLDVESVPSGGEIAVHLVKEWELPSPWSIHLSCGPAFEPAANGARFSGVEFGIGVHYLWTLHRGGKKK